MDDIEKLLLNKGIAAMLPKKEEKKEEPKNKNAKTFVFRLFGYEIFLFVSVTKRR